ncbi:MAG: HlyD family efflux transporter periplasmic adaptor subunit [Methylococcales bacterium]
MSNQDLFRPEVVDARAGRWLGNVLLTQSIPLWVGSLMAVVLAGSLVSYGVIGSYAHKAHVSGILVPKGGEINIAAPVAGRISELRVKEGQPVSANEVLMVLDTDRATSIVDGKNGYGDAAVLVGNQIEIRKLALRNERSLRESQAQVHRQANRDRIANLNNELAKLSDEISLQGQRRELAEVNLKRYESLASSDYVTPVQVQDQKEIMIDQEGRLRSLERTRLNLRRERVGLEAEERQIAADLATTIAGLDREIAGLDQEFAENTARRTTVVVAPRDGTVSAVAIGLGQWISVGQTLAAIQPKGTPLEAQLYSPSRTAGFVASGQQVLLRYAAYPYQKFGLQTGKVGVISQSAFAPSDLPTTLQTQIGQQTTEALYRVTVTLDSQNISTYGENRPLKAGMALEADIVQDRRTIIEWMLEPIFAAAKRT